MSLCQVESPITGTVWRILTGPGATVSEGDELLIVESMRSEVPIEAPSAGVVVSIGVNEGDPVEEGQVVAELDEAHRRY